MCTVGMWLLDVLCSAVLGQRAGSWQRPVVLGEEHRALFLAVL